MKQFTYVINDPIGIHARPAGLLVKAAKALDSLDKLRDCEAHSSVILTAADSGTYAKLGLRLTCTPRYQGSQLYHK